MTFTEVIEEALRHFQDTTWLGEESPLATPYFLGNRLVTPSAAANLRGRALQSLFQEATASLEGKNAERYQTILRQYYFHNLPAAVVWDQVGLGKNSFHLSRNAAIAALEEEIVKRIQPALRLEQPPLAGQLLERQREAAIALAALKQHKSVSLLGNGGIGKSALAASLAAQSARPIFWYTIRTVLNDQLESLLFALALFAQQHGASTLWLALHANRQELASEEILSVLRHSLAQLQPAPLLCLDNLEQLQPSRNSSHLALVNLLESLQGLVPMLWIGDRVPLASDEYITLNGLSPAATAELIEQSGIGLAAARQIELYALTQGNPRLIKLALASFASGEAQNALPADPALEAILSRTLLRLTSEERRLLDALSVYRTPVPMQPWQTRTVAPILNQLLEKQLLQSDGQGSIEIPLVYRQQIYRQLSEQQRISYHVQAAEVRTRGGAYTAAAYHWIEAGQPASAIALWRTHQEREIAQGQATTAYALFKPFTHSEQLDTLREQASLVCAQIDYLHGRSEQVIQQLVASDIATPVLVVEAGELLGMAANERSEFEQAVHAFDQALTVASALVEVRMARLHKGKAWMHLRQRQLDKAEEELGYAHYEIENMRGNLAFDRGNYPQAEEHYQRALQLAEDLTYHEGIGKTGNNLAGIALWLGQFAGASQHLDRAFRAYETIGKVADMAGCSITLAVAHNQAGNPLAALHALARAEGFLIQLGEAPLWQQALIAQAKAEAYLGLGQVEEAESAIQQAIASGEIAILPDAYRVFGEICTQRGATEEAETHLQHSLMLAEQNEDRYLAAYAWRSLTKHYQACGNAVSASEARNNAITLFRELELPHEAEKC